MPRVYVETTIISYLTASPSRDLVLAAHQQVTRDWWNARDTFELYVSQFVVDEASAGDADAAGRRIAAVQDLVLLDLTSDARSSPEHSSVEVGCRPRLGSTLFTLLCRQSTASITC